MAYDLSKLDPNNPADIIEHIRIVAEHAFFTRRGYAEKTEALRDVLNIIAHSKGLIPLTDLVIADERAERVAARARLAELVSQGYQQDLALVQAAIAVVFGGSTVPDVDVWVTIATSTRIADSDGDQWNAGDILVEAVKIGSDCSSTWQQVEDVLHQRMQSPLVYGWAAGGVVVFSRPAPATEPSPVTP